MGSVWLDETQVGTFTPDTVGTTGIVLLGDVNVGTFTLAASGDVYFDATDIGDYTASGPAPPPPPIIPEDARYRTKLYFNTYLDPSHLTKDDDVTPATYAVIYANPNYSITQEFKAATNPVDILFCVGKPDSTPRFSCDRSVYAYKEKIPITIQCIDKPGITGTKLLWKAEAELRRVTETYPFGSIRQLEHMKDRDMTLGSTVVYGAEYTLNYIRDTT